MGAAQSPFPRLRVGTFIEAVADTRLAVDNNHFPAFGWGLSLRPVHSPQIKLLRFTFPRLRVGTFIEAALMTGYP